MFLINMLSISRPQAEQETGNLAISWRHTTVSQHDVEIAENKLSFKYMAVMSTFKKK